MLQSKPKLGSLCHKNFGWMCGKNTDTKFGVRLLKSLYGNPLASKLWQSYLSERFMFLSGCDSNDLSLLQLGAVRKQLRRLSRGSAMCGEVRISSVEFRSNRSNLVQIGWPSRFISTDLASAPGSGEFPSCVSLSVSEVSHRWPAAVRAASKRWPRSTS